MTRQKITREDIRSFDKIYRLNLINSVPGYKSANLLGTTLASGTSNLAVFSSVIHLGSNPPLLGFISRPLTVPRHTYENIRREQYYTINHIHASFVENAHYTSAKFDEGVNEFVACGLTEEYIGDFPAPYVGESLIKLGMKYRDEVKIQANDTILVIGEICEIFVPSKAILPDGRIDLNAVEDVCLSGLNTYHKVTELATYPYARVDHLPDFTDRKK